ncbi:MAG: hypothetical protein A2431_03230 [Candidatus Zambryskibacteria bacterium RIFOXYC1_FULL_39_10]|uniref:Prepilin-type N-terminal cleavage/methylation domain-containing protein n=1 Tax=Candidatus Zambryskibacteria bacterium RIFOXYC1_FULL_39_10 TaxID=1802779 RepID=A0A1G2V0P3_9BACT|nr:MAG: hypothetical protein A2431_03230 [Candidatus Zambryskibacteria bacterium RIFOXYC1_FULL_39_10]OHB16246.1 MAG: hypothetical protein A2605_01380 [Candidatus Zambryskibacteria bacterium RIFOXYD1_FULL_39_35]
MKKIFNSMGFSLVEVIVAVSIAVFSILAVWQTYTFFIKLSFSNPALFQASFLAEEGIEAIKFMRNGSWDSNIAPLSVDSPYSLVFDGNNWQATTTISMIDTRFDRRIYLFDTFRDNFGNISETGTPDSNTRKVKVIVSWQKDAGATSTKEITTYVSNIFQN